MFKEKRIMFLIAETPVHAGSGGEMMIVDLPIQRERHTDFPKIESSGLKGCIREMFESRSHKDEKNQKIISVIFGPEEGETHAGALAITDAKILLFPVKSLKGVFAWITCPLVLERLKRDLSFVGINFKFESYDFSELVNTVPLSSNVVISPKTSGKVSPRVVLEEFSFEVKEDQRSSDLASCLSKMVFPADQSYQFWKDKLKKDLLILDDSDFTNFVRSHNEVITRTRIDSVTGTVQEGALWTEEYLPQDTVMYSLVMFTQPRVKNDNQKGVFKAQSPEDEAKQIAKYFETEIPKVIRIGGNQTIGKGFMRVKILGKEDELC